MSDTHSGSLPTPRRRARWRFVREFTFRHPEALPASLVILGVFVANALYLVGVFDPNPINQTSGLASHLTQGPFPGINNIDPNTGVTAQANGHRAALDWTHGQVPWWNPYEGIGWPLAGEMNAAVFFPLTLLMSLSTGQVYFYSLLEVIAGLGAFFLLRRLSVARWIAVVGGIAFAVNGTFAWFRYSPVNPIAFLPIVLLGVERAYDASLTRRRAGWALVAVGLALSIYAGFPESAFLDGLLAAFWALARAFQLRRSGWLRFLLKLLLGNLVGVALAAPILVAFLTYLPHGDIGGHASLFAHTHLVSASVPALVLPYVYGPIFGFASYDHSQALTQFWSGVGGYLSASLILLGLVGLVGRRERPLRVALALWIVLALGKTYGLPGASQVLNVIPGVSNTAFFRYSPPATDMAVIVLAGLGLDDVLNRRIRLRNVALPVLVGTAAVTIAAACALPEVHRLRGAPNYTLWAFASIAWAFLVVSLVGAGLLLLRGRWQVTTISAVVVVDVLAAFVVPQLSAPRSGTIDVKPVTYLQAHLGMSRFATLGGIDPNYGAYFGLASVNDNDLPVPQAWASYVSQHLDPNENPIQFTGSNPVNPRAPSPTQTLLQQLPAYEAVGVRYLVMPGSTAFPTEYGSVPLREVFSDGLFKIVELPNPSPYFYAAGGSCTLEYSSRQQVVSSCARPTTLVREELGEIPGWTASVNGHPVEATVYNSIFQSVKVPAGRAVISYDFAPPHVLLGLVAVILGAVCLALGELSRRYAPPRPKRAPPADLGLVRDVPTTPVRPGPRHNA